MSKISYCSLEEAWGTQSLDNFNKENQQSKILLRDNYELLNKKSEEDRVNVITNMNLVERNEDKNYDKYRTNTDPTVIKATSSNQKSYVPFKEQIDKKYLEDRLKQLENQLKQYKILIDKKSSEEEQYKKENKEEEEQNKNGNNVNLLETFSNQASSFLDNGNSQHMKSNDMVDLILLIIIGLLIIFVMNSIFTIGKTIGMRTVQIK